MKKIGLIIVIFALVCTMSLSMASCCCPTSNDEGTEGLAYTLLNDDTYAVSAGTARDETQIVIPREYNGKPVTAIAEYAFYNLENLEHVEIPDSVTRIGASSFYGCAGLTSIDIPGSVTKIDDEAFIWCTGLETVTISDGVKTIDSYAFAYCSNLTVVEIPTSVTSIGWYAFYYCTSLNTIKYVGSKASWNAMLKYDNWDTETGNYTIYYNYTGN